MTVTNLQVFPDVDALAAAAAERWCEIARDAVARQGHCDIALAGGSTPRTLYRLLATPAWRERIARERTRFWFGDERCVPPEHPDSNYRMARETLLDPLDIPSDRVFRIAGEREPHAAARDYAEQLARAFGTLAETPPRFDLLLLGLGTDGHIASLFPETPLLDETRDWVGACHVEPLAAWRISLTLPVLNAARHTLILVAGEAKAAIVGDLYTASQRPTPYPVEHLQPAGEIAWLLDSAAATALPGRS